MSSRTDLLEQQMPTRFLANKMSETGARCPTTIRIALMLLAFAAATAEASETISVAVGATVVSVCRFLTSASSVGAGDSGRTTAVSATLTYACSNGTAAAFTFAAPAATNIACNGCSGFPMAVGDVLATSVGIGHGLGAGHDQTLNVSAPLQTSEYDDAAHGAYAHTIMVTVSP